MKYLVTGGAGFIGSHLVDHLLNQRGTDEVRIIDNFSSGSLENINVEFNRKTGPEVIVADITAGPYQPNVKDAFKGIDVVFHLAANPDARRGTADTWLDLQQETVATRNVLEWMRQAQVRDIIFASSGTVYGDWGTRELYETDGPCLPTSLYGAGKLASEGLISAFCGTFGMRSTIFRFGNVIGPRMTHGLMYDLKKQIGQSVPKGPYKILGDGNQSKPYIHVSEVVEALWWAIQGLDTIVSKCDVYNLAPKGATSVRYIVEEMMGRALDKTLVEYGTTAGGWLGDIPQVRMNSDKLAAAGFKVKLSSDEAVNRTVSEMF